MLSSVPGSTTFMAVSVLRQTSPSLSHIPTGNSHTYNLYMHPELRIVCCCLHSGKGAASSISHVRVSERAAEKQVGAKLRAREQVQSPCLITHERASGIYSSLSCRGLRNSERQRASRFRRHVTIPSRPPTDPLRGWLAQREVKPCNLRSQSSLHRMALGMVNHLQFR